MELNAENIINEIQSLIKALKDCGGWVKRGNGEGWFNHEILADALSLIKELTEENERLRAEKECVNKEAFHKWKKLADEIADRYERLYQDAKKALVADTVRKMQSEIQKRCVEGGIYPAFVARTIDEIAKEMLEGEK